MTVAIRTLRLLVLTAAIAGVLAGCGSTGAQKGASGGAALGGVIGGLAGGWEGAAIGALAGGGIGYMAGNEGDKEKAKEQAEREQQALQQAHITSNPNTAYRPPNRNALTGSTWRVISIVAENEDTPDYHSMVVTFATNSKMTSLTVLADGSTETRVENYRVVDDVLVISTKDYVINAKYAIDDGQMIVTAPDLRVVLEEVEEEV